MLVLFFFDTNIENLETQLLKTAIGGSIYSTGRPKKWSTT